MKELRERFLAGLRQSILIVTLFITGFAHGTTWYINKTGSDSYNGTLPAFGGGVDGPKLTISAALAIASDGDTLVVGKGVYSERVEVQKSLYIHTDSVVVSKFIMNGISKVTHVYGDTLEVLDSLGLLDGILVSKSPSYFLFCPNICRVGGGSAKSYLDGRLYRQVINGSGALYFPVGVEKDFRSIVLDYNQNVPDTRIHWMQVYRGSPGFTDTLPTGIRNKSKQHYWQFGRLGSGNYTDYIARITYDSAGLDDQVPDPTHLRVLYTKGTGNWTNLTGQGNNAFAGTISASFAVNSDGFFTFGNIAGGLNPLGSFIAFAGFKIAGSCELHTTNFTDTSSSASPSKIVKWSWDFGDTSVTTDTSSTPNPNYTYSKPGIYKVKLIVTNDSFSVDSSEVLWEIHPQPQVKFSNTLLCSGKSALFSDSSTVALPDTILTRKWYFGDGNTDSTKKAMHVYADTGVYKVRLIVISDNGCADSIETNVVVNRTPLAGFKVDAVCQGVASQFTDTSKIAIPDNIVASNWNMGDGNFRSGPLVNYTYAVAGNYNAILVVTSNNGCRDTAVKSVTVRPLPKVYIENGPVCFGQLSRFKDTSSVALPQTITNSTWHLGDGTISVGKSISYTYGVAGNYNVKLIITTSSGCKDSVTRSTTVNKKPTPSFNTSSVCIGENSSFVRDISTDPPDNEITYTWYDNYVLKKTGINYSAALVGAGDHTITLIGTTNKGCKDSMVLTETINSKPALNFYLDKTFSPNDSIQCLKGNKFTFFRKATAGQGQTVTATWIWGDGTFGTLADSSHSYAAIGNYSVKLKAVTNAGCEDSLSKTYIVRGSVVPDFGKLGTCTPDSITFFDSASFSTSAITSRKWILPAGGSASGIQTKQWIKQTGPINIKYILTNAEGCTDSISKAYFFTPYPVISFLVSGSLPFCPGDSISVRADGGLKMLWQIDNDTNRNKTFKTAGYFRVTASNSPACFVEDSFFVILYPPANIKLGKDTTIYRGDKATLRASGGTSYLWTPSLTLNKNFGPIVSAAPVDSQQYIVTSQTINGCKGSDTIIVYVIDRDLIRIPNLITPNDDGENDAWVLSDLKNLGNYDVVITNYAGKIVFQSSNYKNDWNATDKGTVHPEGIYYYQLENRTNGEKFKGFIQVIR